jgi:hypothetical protein
MLCTVDWKEVNNMGGSKDIKKIQWCQMYLCGNFCYQLIPIFLLNVFSQKNMRAWLCKCNSLFFVGKQVYNTNQ